MSDRPERNVLSAVFNGGRGRYELKMPDCLDLPLTKLKKLFTIICKEHYINLDFESVIVPTIEGWLAYQIEQEKENWHTASVTFQSEYRDASFIRSPYQKREAERKNNAMMREVKAAKKAYEGYQKRLSAWMDIKAKYVD